MTIEAIKAKKPFGGMSEGFFQLGIGNGELVMEKSSTVKNFFC